MLLLHTHSAHTERERAIIIMLRLATNSNDDDFFPFKCSCFRHSPFAHIRFLNLFVCFFAFYFLFFSSRKFQFVHQLQTKTTELLIFNFFVGRILVIALLFPKLKINISILGLHCLRMAPCKLHRMNLFLSNIGWIACSPSLTLTHSFSHCALALCFSSFHFVLYITFASFCACGCTVHVW